MKNAKIAILSIIVLFTACKTRQVSLRKVDSTSVIKESLKTDSLIKTNDTTSTQTKKLIVVTDSGKTTTIITPDSGQVIIFNANTGTFTGKAKSIETVNNFDNKKQVSSNSDTQKDSSKTLSYQRLIIASDSVHVLSKTKNTISTPDYKWIFYVAGVVVFLALCFYLYKKFVPKVI